MLGHESSMLRHAANRGLPVPACHARGEVRACGMPVEQALLLEWFDGTPLRQIIIGAARNKDVEAARGAIAVLVSMMARIRLSGFADRDFALAQILVAADAPPAEGALWIDLEATMFSDAEDPVGTAIMTATALSSVWNATCDAELFRHTFNAIMHQVPAPKGGWATIIDRVNGAVYKRVDKAIRHDRVDAPAPVLKAG